MKRTIQVVLVAALVVVSVWLGGATPARAGSIAAWGYNGNGACDAPTEDDFIALSAGGRHNVALRSDGSLAAWGSNAYGQANPPGGTDFTAIAGGGFHSVALMSDGSVLPWGDNWGGQLENVPVGNDFTTIAAGGRFSLALRSDGSIAAWGHDSEGQITGTPATGVFTAVAGGWEYALALNADGSIAAWGQDTLGQVSNAPAGNDFVTIAAGKDFGLALRSDGSIAAWGNDDNGQVSNTPAGTDFVAVSGGVWACLALKSDGSLVAWGWDKDGQISDMPDVTDPADPWFGATFADVSVGYYHLTALTGTLAEPLLWDADTGVTDAQDGNGAWSDGGDNWWDGEGNVAWDNTKKTIATFGAGNATADPTVTVGTVTADGITFNDAAGYRYTLSGGTITLEGGAPTIEANVDARIESVIAGTARWVKTGAGTLEVTGANTYTGGVAVDDGTLVGDTGSILGDVTLSNDSNVTFNQASDGSYDGTITGDGSFAKTGAGTLEVTSQDHTYTGDATVSAGTLRATGWLPLGSTVTVDAGGTLGGTGRVAAIDLLRDGTLAPGASVGTLTADGNVTLGAGAAYEWEVNDLDYTIAGVDWDLLNIDPGFNLIVSATSGDPFTIKVISLDSLGDPGTAGGTLEESDSFEIARASFVDGFSTDAFTIDTSAFQNAMGGLEFVVAERFGSLYLDLVTVGPVILPSLTITDGSKWDELPIDSPLVLSEVTGTLAVEDSASLALEGATISVGLLQVAAGGTVNGHGTVNGPIGAAALSMIEADGGDLVLGDADRFDGFSTEGTLVVGANSVTLHAEGFAGLGILTELDGGTLAAPNGVIMGPGDNLAGSGAVNAKVSAYSGSTIGATGDLALGDSTSVGGFFSDGELYTGAHTVTINDANEAVLGSITELGDGAGGGTLTAGVADPADTWAHFLLEQGKNTIGRGDVNGNFKNHGHVIGDGYMTLDERIIFNNPWIVTGKGTFENTAIFGTFAPGDSPCITSTKNMLYGPSSIIRVELGGTEPGSGDDNHSQINDANIVWLLGSPTLEILSWKSFVPEVGDEFVIMTWATGLEGLFGAVETDALFTDNGTSFALHYTNVGGAGNLTLEAVPEPATLALLGLGLGGLLLRRRR